MESGKTWRDLTLQLAWASGFFDGEGCTGSRVDKRRPNSARIYVSVGQQSKSREIVPSVLTRFQRAVGGMGYDGVRSADFLPMSQGPFEGYEGIFNPRLLGADRARILLACVEREFWRQTTQARPGAELADDSAAPKPSR